MKSTIIVVAIDKLLGLFKSKEENKNQKITTFSKTISIMTIIVLVACILNSLFPNYIKIDSWIYDLLEKLINYITVQ
ncbi:hypothetical protein [Cetobacterium sp.]|uniref:hypothetical protein n=1 Tax=Cetobacterium sp. TaxID=2071632 RepID=UPI003F2B7488